MTEKCDFGQARLFSVRGFHSCHFDTFHAALDVLVVVLAHEAAGDGKNGREYGDDSPA